MKNNDLISRMGLLLSLPLFEKDQNGYPLNGGIQYARAMIEAAPSMDAEFVQHGQWKAFQPGKNMILTREEYLFRCTCCDAKYSDVEGFRFCPYCGALMDGKDDT